MGRAVKVDFHTVAILGWNMQKDCVSNTKKDSAGGDDDNICHVVTYNFLSTLVHQM